VYGGGCRERVEHSAAKRGVPGKKKLFNPSEKSGRRETGFSNKDTKKEDITRKKGTGPPE